MHVTDNLGRDFQLFTRKDLANMVLIEREVVERLSSPAGLLWMEATWLSDGYHHQQEAFQALVSILTRGKYTSSPKTWLKQRGVLAVFAQLASVDVELDPKPERGVECDLNPVNAPSNSPRSAQVKSRVPSRVTPLEFAKGMADLGDRWKHLQPDEIMSVALLIQDQSSDGCIGKKEFTLFFGYLEEILRTQDYKNSPTHAIEQLYLELMKKKRDGALSCFYAEWLGANANPNQHSDSATAFQTNARTCKMVQFQLEELAAQVRAGGGSPLIQLEHLRGKVENEHANGGRGGVPVDILTAFLESLGGTVGTSRSGGDAGEGTPGTPAVTASPLASIMKWWRGGAGGGTPAKKASSHASFVQNVHSLQSPLSNLSPIPVALDSSYAAAIPTYELQAYKASTSDAQGALKELRNNAAYISQQVASQATNADFEAALRSYHGLVGGGFTSNTDGLQHGTGEAREVPQAPAATERQLEGEEQKEQPGPPAIDQRLAKMTVDTTWASAYEPSDASSSTSKALAPTVPAGLNSVNTENSNASSTAITKKKVDLSIFKSPKKYTTHRPVKRDHERLSVKVHDSHGAAPMTKPTETRSERNKSALEESLMRRKSFKH